MTGFAWRRLVWVAACLGSSVLLAACVRFEPQPISAENNATKFAERSLDDAGLRLFLESETRSGEWPKPQWTLDDLTLAALYFNPDLDVLRAQLASSRAAEITAGQRPAPSLALSGGTAAQADGIPSGLATASVDLAIETAGKRGYRLAQAAYLSEAAAWDLAGTVQQVAARVRAGMLALYGTRSRRELLQRLAALQAESLRMLEAQLGLGAVSAVVVSQARIALQETRFALIDLEQRETAATAELASAIGIPPAALAGADLAFRAFEALPGDVPDEAARRRALVDRPDIRSALASYAASQAALQLEIAKQYPDIRLGPAYELDQGNDKWLLGVSLAVPLLTRNKGPIAEAEARRAESAAQFDALQARAANQIDEAVAGYRVALTRASTAAALGADVERQEAIARAMRELGEISPLELVQRQVELNASALLELDAQLAAQESLGALQGSLRNIVAFPEALWLSSPRQSMAAEQP